MVDDVVPIRFRTFLEFARVTWQPTIKLRKLNEKCSDDGVAAQSCLAIRKVASYVVSKGANLCDSLDLRVSVLD